MSKQSAGLSDTLAHQIVFHRRKKVRLTVWLITTCYGLFRYTTDTFCAVDPFSILSSYIIVCPVTPQVELFVLWFYDDWILQRQEMQPTHKRQERKLSSTSFSPKFIFNVSIISCFLCSARFRENVKSWLVCECCFVDQHFVLVLFVALHLYQVL